MQQQINLYLPEFRQKKEALDFSNMVKLLGVLLGLMLLNFAYDSVDTWLLSNRLETLQATLAEETRKTEELDELLARRSENNELSNRLETAETRLESSRQIRNFLGQTKLGNTAGFSEYFKDLSRAALQGMSITEFRFSEGGEKVELSGQVVDSALVPRYVNNIESGQSPLRQLHFSPSISRDDVNSQFFSFALSSENE
jgi:hypothetical protein